MNDYLVTTLPMKPLKKIKVGSLTAPLYVNFIGDKLKIKKVLSLNILNSFDDLDYSKEYTNILKNININYDDIFVDKEHMNELLNQIQRLDEMGLLIEKEDKIMSCDCDKIDMLYSSINSFENGLLKHIGDNYICNSCGSICKVKKEKRLFLKIDKTKLKKIKAIPFIHDDNLSSLMKMLEDTDYLISKGRTTGVFYNGYNLDIDFVWSNYLSLFNEKNIIVITSNRHLMKVIFTNYFANIFNKKVIYILHPYIEKREPIDWDETLFKYDYLYQHLYLIYNCRWNSKCCFYDVGMFSKLAKLRGEGRFKLYNYLLNNNGLNNVFKYLNSFLSNKINFQNNIKYLTKSDILIADYDNTLHIYFDSLVKLGYKFKFNSQYYSDSNVNKKINKFRNNRLFCINTGRSYKSLKKVCNYEYDYLICNSGSEIYDESDNLLYLCPISQHDIDTINKYNFENNKTKFYYPNKAKKKYNMTAVSITVDDEHSYNKIIKYFNENLETTKVYYKYPKIRLVNNLTNKLKATNKLLEMININRQNVYAIGDDDNDYEILKEFKSGTFEWASNSIKKEGIKEYDSALEFMNKIDGGKYEE